VVDNLSTGKLKNLNPSATFHHTDITHPSVDEVFKREHPDLVFHLAAQTSVSKSTRDPIDDGEINVIGTLRIAEASRRHGVDKFVYSSTGGALYGDPEESPCSDDHPVAPLSPYGMSKYPEESPCSDDHPVAPLSPYGMSKYLGEAYLEFYRRQYRLNYTTLRYGNVYGPRQDPHGEAGVVSIFAQAMLEGKQPEIFGDGNQERDFISVEDVVEANICAIERGDGRAMNIGTGEQTSINRVFEILKSIIGYRWAPVHGSPRPGDVYQISLDCTRAIQELGWQPQVNLEDGLRKTVNYFRETVKTAR
jgi:UDP-glucose 4-epimerase